ncbi:site-specific integrase [Haloarculaceae archaeon H-GB2-1]|nr:site-specific integrase [Haloarculaceae archaeon H-GB2-1]
MSGARNLSPAEAVERWLDKRSIELRDQTVETHQYRLKLFADWCEENEIETMDQLTGWDVDTYETDRRSIATQITLSKELGTLKNFLEWAEGIGVLSEGVAEVVDPPKMPADPSSNVKLAPSDATTLIEFYRSSDERASRSHALLELVWFTGARVGGIRSLDVRDYFSDEQYVRFVHRPESGTVLKKGSTASAPSHCLRRSATSSTSTSRRTGWTSTTTKAASRCSLRGWGVPLAGLSATGCTTRRHRAITDPARTRRTQRPVTGTASPSAVSARRRGRPTRFGRGL